MGKTWSGTLNTPSGDRDKLSIPMMLNHITDEICENYCKYQDMLLNKNPGGMDADLLEDMLYQEYCANCPLMMI